MGYTIEAGRLEPTGTKVAPGVQLEFDGIAQVGDRSFPAPSRDTTLYDARNVALTTVAAICRPGRRPGPADAA